MPTSEQLYLRALRMLNDDFQHEAAAIEWAKLATGLRADERGIPPEPLTGFTLRELSLGA